MLNVALFASGILYVALAIWGWGEWSSFFAHPARLGVVISSVALTAVACLSPTDVFHAGKRADVADRRIFLPAGLVTLALAWVPAYTDRRALWVIDGDAVRYLGLILFIAGGVLRVAPMFALGHRFTAFVAIQPGHTLKTDGLYRWIRHPSYLGGYVNVAGWALVFRSAIGLILGVLLIVPGVARIRSEERLLESEFGPEYVAYRRRTWRVVPFLY